MQQEHGVLHVVLLLPCHATRYYRGRHFLQERSRTAKRIQLAGLRRQQQQQSHIYKSRTQRSALLLPQAAPLMPPPAPSALQDTQRPSTASAQGSSTAVLQHAGARERRLAIPASSFIPLEVTPELLAGGNAAGGVPGIGADGCGAAAVAAAGGGIAGMMHAGPACDSRQGTELDPAVLVEEVSWARGGQSVLGGSGSCVCVLCCFPGCPFRSTQRRLSLRQTW